MAKEGAALQTYNNELVKTLEELKHGRRALDQQIRQDEQERAELAKLLSEVQSKMDVVDARLNFRLEKREQYDKIISDSEQGYLQILESAQVLLNVARKGLHDIQAEHKS